MADDGGDHRISWPVKVGTFAIVCALSAGAGWYLLRDRVIVSDGGVRLASARDASRWLAPVPFGERFNTAGDEFDPALSPDGSELYFARRVGDGFADLYVSRLVAGAWTTPEPIAAINTRYDEVSPRLTADGKYLLFVSDSPGGFGQYDIWAARRDSGGWGTPLNLGPGVNSARDEYSPAPSFDGRRLFFSSNRNARPSDTWGGKLRRSTVNDFDLFVAGAITDRNAPALAFTGARALTAANSPFHEGPVSSSNDGFIYFSSNRPGGLGGFDVYRATLTGEDASAIENVGAPVNTEADDADAQLTSDGLRILFSSNRGGSRGEDDLYMAEARPAPTPLIPRELPKIGASAGILAIALVLLLPLVSALRSPSGRDLLSKCILLSLLMHVLLAMSFSAVHVSRGIIAYVSEGEGTGGTGADLEIPLNLEVGRVAELQLQVRNQITELPSAAPPVETPRMETMTQVEIDAPKLTIETSSPARVNPTAMAIRVGAPEPPTALPVDAVAVEAPRIEPFTPDLRVRMTAPVNQEDPRVELDPARPVGSREERSVEAAPAEQTVLGTVPVRPDTSATGNPVVSTIGPDLVPRALPEPIGLEIVPSLPAAPLGDRSMTLPRVSAAPTPRAAPPVMVAEAVPAGPRISIPGEPGGRKTEVLRPNETRLPVDPVSEAGAGRVGAPRGGDAGESVAAPRPQVAIVPLIERLGPDILPRTETLAQRAPEQRQSLVDQMGGNRASEEAAARALEWLARNQERDGRWTNFSADRSPRRSRADTDRHDPALTGLAVLCFLASDHGPHKAGRYREAVRAGLEFLLRTQERTGDLRGRGNMYDHGIAAIALGEAALMSGEERYRQASMLAAKFTIEAQREETGGWQYHPGDYGDTSVVAWQLMALHSAARLGYEVPARTRSGAAKWLERVSSGRRGVLSGYQNDTPTPSMTAQGLFSRVLLGQEVSTEGLREATDLIISEPPGSGAANFYYWYCASLSLMQFQNDAWTRWNLRTREHLVSIQRRGGDGDGSFDPDPKWTHQGGRVCSTAFAALTLQVYYRYLPIHAGR